MACLTLSASRMAMSTTTTQLTRTVRHEFCAPTHSEQNFERRIPSMNWVVVTGNDGVPHLRMHWTAIRS